MAIIISKTKLQWDCHKSVDNYSIVNCVTTEIMGYQSRFTHIYPHNNIQKLHCSYNLAIVHLPFEFIICVEAELSSFTGAFVLS